MSRTSTTALALVFAAFALQPLHAQWDPDNGLWGKSDERDLRIMTWNVEDGICSTQPKLDGQNAWGAMSRIVALLKPDILVMQEAGDNSGNGTGGGVDAVGTLATVAQLFIEGGEDPFLGGQVTGYVQLWAPGFELPYIFVSSDSDGFNRNVILSRYPFADLNGDAKAEYSDIPTIQGSPGYAVGGDGGIRGFMLAEIDLDDALYAGDLVVGNAHLRAGGSNSDKQQREDAARNVAYVVDHWYNGGGAGVPDPDGAIRDLPPATDILGENTPVVLAGDWNEDELSNGRKGPAEWLAHALNAGGSDGTDRDRSDSTYDDARDVFTNNRATFASSKLDYTMWQDSIATLRRGFVFNSANLPTPYPPEFDGITRPANLSGNASDHRPVIIDLILPEADIACTGDVDGDGDVDFDDLGVLLGAFGNNDAGDLDDDGDTDFDDLGILLGAFGQAC